MAVPRAHHFFVDSKWVISIGHILSLAQRIMYRKLVKNFLAAVWRFKTRK